jgi:hypothetical protein
MSRLTVWGLLVKVIGIVAFLVGVGLLVKIIAAILTPILPPTFTATIAAGWGNLYSLVGPSIAPIAALAIVALIAFTFIGKR